MLKHYKHSKLTLILSNGTFIQRNNNLRMCSSLLTIYSWMILVEAKTKARMIIKCSKNKFYVAHQLLSFF